MTDSKIVICEVSDQPLDVEAHERAVQVAGAGAHVVFCGVVREFDHGREVTELDYEGHPGAQDVLNRVSAALDTDTLNSALNNNFSDIEGFLQNTSSFGQSFAMTLNSLGAQAPNGTVYLAQQQNSAQEAALNKSISDEDARIAAQKVSLTTELNTANEILQSIPSQLDQINEIYSAITGYNTGNK